MLVYFVTPKYQKNYCTYIVVVNLHRVFSLELITSVFPFVIALQVM